MIQHFGNGVGFYTNLVLKKRQIVSIFCSSAYCLEQSDANASCVEGYDGWGKKGRKVSCFYSKFVLEQMNQFQFIIRKKDFSVIIYQEIQ